MLVPKKIQFVSKSSALQVIWKLYFQFEVSRDSEEFVISEYHV